MSVSGPRGTRIAGVVLAGGRSRRMGATKALVEIDGRPMAGRVLDALHAGGCDPLVIGGGDPEELSSLGVPVWPDDRPGAGPAAGVAGVLRRMSDHGAGDVTAPGRRVDAVVVVACDLPGLHAGVVEQLVAGLGRAPAADVCVARTDRREPLCGIWRSTVASSVAEAVERGVEAMHELLSELRVVEVQIDRESLYNVNTPDDVRRVTK